MLLIKAQHFFFQVFFLATIIQWNNLDLGTGTLKSLIAFLKLKAYNSPYKNFNHCHDRKWIKIIRRLCAIFNDFWLHKFAHCFQDLRNSMRHCGNDFESTTFYFLHCPKFKNERHTLKIVKNWSKLIPITNPNRHTFFSFLSSISVLLYFFILNPRYS